MTGYLRQYSVTIEARDDLSPAETDALRFQIDRSDFDDLTVRDAVDAALWEECDSGMKNYVKVKVDRIDD